MLIRTKVLFLARSLLALVGVLLICMPATAATFVEKNFAQLVGEAEQIFIGTLSSLQSRKLDSGVIVTDAGFSDLQILKGATGNTGITLLIAGGEVDGLRMDIPGVPTLTPSARYLVFSKGNGKDIFPVVGGTAGIFRVVAGSSGAGALVLDSSDRPVAGAVAADVLASASAPSGPVTLELFVSAIQAQLARQ